MRAQDRRRRRRRPTGLGELVGDLVRGHGVAGPVREARLVAGWAAAVGDRVAARAWPDGLEAGVLHVRVANSSWMHELSFLRAEIARQVNAAAGDPPLVREIRFHVGRRRATREDDAVATIARRRTTRPRRPQPELSADALRAIDEETAGVADPELREAIRGLRRRLGV